MSFVFSVWYIVALFLVAGIAACLFIFFKMDKQDKVLIDEFINGAQTSENSTSEATNETSTDKVE